jgi:hypothetical protein
MVENLDVQKENQEIKALLKDFFSILNTREVSDSGTEFSPVYISSCRVLLTESLGAILQKLKLYIQKDNVVDVEDTEKAGREHYETYGRYSEECNGPIFPAWETLSNAAKTSWIYLAKKELAEK